MDMSSSSPVITDQVAISPPLLGGMPSNLMPFSVMSGGYSGPGMNGTVSSRKIEEVIVNGLLDAMKSSSPRKKNNLAFDQDDSPYEDPDHSAWMVSLAVSVCSFE
jgi:trehalose 6-phosphate phosphatase